MAVEYQLTDQVALVTLNRPEVFNAIDDVMSAELRDVLKVAGAEAKALVITGAGKAFCAGADLAALKSEYQREVPNLLGIVTEQFNPVIEALATLPIPTVAAVNGPAAGAGLGIALACDVRLMTDSAYLMCAFSRVGLIPDSGTTWFLTHMVGVGRALDMALTARKIGAEEAAAVGLALRVHPPESLLAAAMAAAAGFATGPTDALVATRRLLLAASCGTLAEALSAEASEQGRLGRSPNHVEGVAAFIGKRPPQFRS